MKIDKMFAFVCEEAPGEEGIMAVYLEPEMSWLPLVGADMTRVRALIPIAEKASFQTGCPYKILEFELKGEMKKSC